MSDSLEAHIFPHYTQGATSDAIYRRLHVGPNRVSRVLGFFRDNHHLPPSPQKSWKLNVKAITDHNLSSIRNRQKNRMKRDFLLKNAIPPNHTNSFVNW
jgi:hypothetical protein